jgi:NAD(P)H-hydrate epimerase
MQVLPKRKPWSHKYDFGHLLVVGGNWKYSGSPAFNALGALRSGVDLVTIVSPERSANIVAKLCPDMITVPINGDYLSTKHVERIKCIAKNEKVTAIVIGGGIGRQPETFKAVKKIHCQLAIPFVFDADAIHAIVKEQIALRSHDILTPHAGEFAVLFGKKPSEQLSVRIAQTKKLASRLGCVILLKGHIDIISDGKRSITIKKPKECVYMTKGGTGDILAGVVGSLVAQDFPPFKAAYLGTLVTGKAGALVGKEKGAGLLASDLLETIPQVVKHL